MQREAPLIVQEDFSEEVTSEQSSEQLEGATDPQGLDIPGVGDKISNPDMLLFCRRNRKICAPRKAKNRSLGLCVFVSQFSL